MSNSARRGRLLAAAGLVALALLGIYIGLVGFGGVHGGAVWAFIAGALIAVVLVLAWVKGVGATRLAIVVGAITVLVVAGAVWEIPLVTSVSDPSDTSPPPDTVDEHRHMVLADYEAVIVPTHLSEGRFTLKEEAAFEPCQKCTDAAFVTQGQIIETRTSSIIAKRMSWCLSRIEIEPLARVVDSDSGLAAPHRGEDAKATVFVDRMPARSILQVAGGGVEPQREGTIETAEWEPKDVERTVGITYFRPPFNGVRPLVEPFMSLSDFWSKFGSALAGLASTMLLTLATVKVHEPFEKWLRRERQKPDDSPYYVN